MKHIKDITAQGKSLNDAKKVIIMLHGRGADAAGILTLSHYLPLKDFAQLAPQATNHTWYPYSFMAPDSQNQPWLNSALDLLQNLVEEVLQQGFKTEDIYLLGFSQGACLTLEFAARNAKRYGGVIAFTGGLIGEQINRENYKGDFAGTPVFIGSSDVDMHVPLQRVYASSNILREMGANVIEKIYPGMAHTINDDEIRVVTEEILQTETEQR
jgi:phospholipase/carboxylesterase